MQKGFVGMPSYLSLDIILFLIFFSINFINLNNYTKKMQFNYYLLKINLTKKFAHQRNILVH